MVQCYTCHLLLLLATVIFQCGATEYYVRPTEPTNTSCPGQPCLTLNQYINNSSHYIQSNVVFTFLPGKHVIERLLEIRNVENVTLKGTGNYPQLIAKFSCWSNYHCSNKTARFVTLLNYFPFKDCSVIQLINVAHVNISGIHFTMSTVNVSAIKVERSTNIHLQLDIYSVNSGLDKNGCNIGIMAYETNHLYVDKLHVSNLLYGLILCKNQNAQIKESVFEHSGLLVMKSDSVHIISTDSSGNKETGVELLFCNNTSIVNIATSHNNDSGMVFTVCRNTSIVNITTAHNNGSGVVFTSCSNTSIANAYSINNEQNGMSLGSCNGTSITNVSVTHNREYGMFFLSCTNTSIITASANINQMDGIYLESCNNTSIINANSSKNQNHGISLFLCKNTIVACAYTTHNQNGGILIEEHSLNNTVRNISLNNNGYAGIFLLSQSQLQLEDSVFSDVIPLSSPSDAGGFQTLPAIIEVIDSTLIVRNCNYIWNSITSIRAVGSNITLQGDIIFANNQALVGTVLHFSQSSVLVISETSSVIFENNYAINYGGAVYIDTEETYSPSVSISETLKALHLVTASTRCFIHVEGDRSQARLTFVNNIAGRGGDVVYGGLVALGYDGDWNCLQSFKNVSNMSQQSSLSLISSAPSRVCLCKNDHFEHPDDCLTVADPHTYSVYPGQTITLPAVVVGQDFGTVTGSAIAQFLPQPYTTCSIDLEQGQDSTSVDKGKCKNLEYSLYTRDENCTAILVLNTASANILQPMTIEDNHKVNQSWKILNLIPNYHELAGYLVTELYADSKRHNASKLSLDTIKNFQKFTPDQDIFFACFTQSDSHTCKVDELTRFVFPKEIYGYPTFINISFNSCPLGFSISTNPPFKCDCNHFLQLMPRVKCDIQEQRITRDGLVWIGTHSSGALAASKYCPYNYCTSTQISLTLQEPDYEHGNHSSTDTQCNYRHSGILCGGCQPGLSLAFGSDRCLHCSNVYISLLLPFAMAGVVLVFLIKFLNLTISQGTMNALIFYANVVSTNKHLYYNSTSINPTTLFIAWFNLDIGIETCFFNGLTAYIRTWLQFVFPLYIWTIAGLIIVLAKYNDRVAKVMGNNGVPVLATLFLLSYAKLFNTIIRVLSFTTLQTTQGQHFMWSVDGNIVYLGPEHAPLFAVAVAVLVFLWLPYTLILLLGQWLYRLNYHLIARLLLKLKPFLDAHYAPFKDRHRYWFGLLLLARVATLLTSAIIPQITVGIIEFSTALLCMVLTFWGQNVYHNSVVGNFSTAFFLNLAIINVTTLFSSSNISVASFTLIGIALAQFVGLVLYKLIALFKCIPKVRPCCFCQREAEDDWELYDEAALLRGRKSDSEEDRQSDISGSIDSLPTY